MYGIRLDGPQWLYNRLFAVLVEIYIKKKVNKIDKGTHFFCIIFKELVY